MRVTDNMYSTFPKSYTYEDGKWTDRKYGALGVAVSSISPIGLELLFHDYLIKNNWSLILCFIVGWLLIGAFNLIREYDDPVPASVKYSLYVSPLILWTLVSLFWGHPSFISILSYAYFLFPVFIVVISLIEVFFRRKEIYNDFRG